MKITQLYHRGIQSTVFNAYLNIGLLVLLFFLLGEGLTQAIFGTDSTKLIYRLVIVIPGLLLIPKYCAQLKATTLILPICFLMYGVVSNLWSGEGGEAEFGSSFERGLYIISFLVTVYHCVDNSRIFEKGFVYLAAVAMVPACADIVHYLFYHNHPRLHGALGALNPNTIGLIYGISTLAFINTVVARKTQLNWGNALLLISSIVATIALFLTESRASILSLIAAFALLFLIHRKTRVLVMIATVLISSTFSAMALRTLKFEDKSFDSPIKSMVHRSTNRLPIWEDLIQRMEPAEYIYGRGISVNKTINKSNSGDEKYIYPHSIYVSSFYYFGAIGFILNILMLLVMLRASFKQAIVGRSFLPCLFSFSLIPSLMDGNSIHPQLAYIAPHLLMFWLVYSLATAERANYKITSAANG